MFIHTKQLIILLLQINKTNSIFTDNKLESLRIQKNEDKDEISFDEALEFVDIWWETNKSVQSQLFNQFFQDINKVRIIIFNF